MELQAISFIDGAYGELPDLGSSHTKRIMAANGVTLTYDERFQAVRVMKKREDKVIVDYFVPREALCQIHPKRKDGEAATIAPRGEQNRR